MADKQTSQKLDAVVGRAIRDEEFRQKVIADPRAALEEEGLTEDELDQVAGGISAAALQPNLVSPAAARQNFLGSISAIFQKPGLPQVSMACWCTDKTCNERG